MSNQNPPTHKHRFDVWHDTLGMDVTPKKGKLETKIFFFQIMLNEVLKICEK